MGIYTSYNEEWIDARLHSKLQLITNLLIQNIPGISSIALTGGFGRGEGSVLFAGQNDLKLMKDFDLVVVVDRIPTNARQQSLLDTIYEQLNLKNAEREKFRFSQFVVDIRYLKKADLAYPDIWFYDLKSASKILYGQEISNHIPYKAKDIPISSGFRILFEKVTGLLGHFSYDYLRGVPIEKEKRDALRYECLKTYIEIGTALCILAGRYQPSYYERSKILKEIFETKLKDLSSQIPDLPSLVEKATTFKLKPDSVIAEEDPLEMWFRTRDHLGTIIKYYLSKSLKVDIDDWTDLPRLSSLLSKKYYIPLLESWVRQRTGQFGTSFVTPLNYLYNILLNLEYIYQIRKNEHKLFLRPLKRPISPSLKFYLAAPLVLFALDKKGGLKREYLDQFIDELSFCIPIDHEGYNKSWESARDYYLRAYRLYTGFHMVK